MSNSLEPGSAGAWLLASRPKTLPAAVVPVAVGTACAYSLDSASWDAAAAALIGALFIQVGTNLANDVYDHEKGADTGDRLGPTRAVQAGLLSPRQVRIGMAVTFLLASVAGLYLASVAGWQIFAVGVVSILAGIAYTGGPFPLAYNGLGDVFVMVFFGFVAVCGTAWVQMGAVPALAVLAALPVGALATAMLVVNNLRDVDTDRLAGKRTLVVRFGRSQALAQYPSMLLLAYGAVIAMVFVPGGSWAALLPLLTLPLAFRLHGELRSRTGTALNNTLAGTAKLLLLFGFTLAVGLASGL
jgi:1,4-dihydroxy-2-naphthoate polyprenyltransferase